MSSIIASITLGFYVRLVRAEYADRITEMKEAWAKREDWWMRERIITRDYNDGVMSELRARHAAEIERLTNLLTIGSTARKEAVISDGEPDAESRVLKRISEDTIEAGSSRSPPSTRSVASTSRPRRFATK
jgi:hypothetical protein